MKREFLGTTVLARVVVPDPDDEMGRELIRRTAETTEEIRAARAAQQGLRWAKSVETDGARAKVLWPCGCAYVEDGSLGVGIPWPCAEHRGPGADADLADRASLYIAHVRLKPSRNPDGAQ